MWDRHFWAPRDGKVCSPSQADCPDVPWYFRRSFGRGPFRVNLSTRGIGASVGVKGLRVGTGPRGAYVRAGRGGFYYQQYLGSGRSSRRAFGSDGPFRPDVGPPTDHVLLGNPVEFVGEAEQSADTFIDELNRRRAQFRWSTLCFGW